jgi:hypothetical protein
MKKKILRSAAIIILMVFTVSAFIQPKFAYADVKTGSIKVFSEVKGVEIFVDDKSQGTDKAEIDDIEPGQHYVKALYNNAVIYSELITVNPGVSSAVLIKSSGETKQNIINSMYKEQQEYKSKKLDILLSQNVHTVGTAYTDYNNFPGYFSFLDYSTTNMSSTQYTTTDWKIIQGGVQQISDDQFAYLVNDTATISRIQADQEDIESGAVWGGVFALSGLVLAIAGIAAGVSAKTDADMTGPAIIATIGIVGTCIGLALLSKSPYMGHWVTPAVAAQQAHDYNQKIKLKLNLPENFEPQ